MKPKVVMLKQSDILMCKFCIIDPRHYRPDGSCKCNDRAHRAFMIKNWGYKQEDFANIPLRKP